MGRVSTIFTNFIVGEVSPRQEGNADLQFYQQSCRILENFIISSHGGVERTPGTKYICDAEETTYEGFPSRLIPFRKGTTQYVLEFSESHMRVINGLTQVEVSATPYQVNTTYSYAQVMNIHYAQVAENLMYLTEVGDRPQKVTCTSSASWTISNLVCTGITFSTANSYPSAICVFEQKLVFAGSNTNPNRIWFSKPGAFTNFQSASGSFTIDVYTPERMQIKWLVAAKDAIVFGSDTAVGIITGNGAALSSSNFQIRIETAIGTTELQGLFVGDTIIYPQVGARTLREFAYTDDGQSWYTRDLTMLAEHLSPLEGFGDMALQVNPDIILWVAAGAKGLCGLTYDKVAQIQGWHRHNFESGSVEAVCVTRPHSSIVEDIVYLCVYREQGRTIEYMTPRDFGDDQTDAYFVHCGAIIDLGVKDKTIYAATKSSTCTITASAYPLASNDIVRIRGVVGMIELNDKYYVIGSAVEGAYTLLDIDGVTPINSTSFGTYVSGGTVTKIKIVHTGLNRLAGETVSVLADGAAHPDVVVSSTGTVTLQVYANKIHVGYGYTSILKPQRIEAGADDGTAQGAVKRIHKVIVRVFESLGCKIGPDVSNLDTVIFRTASDVMGAPPPLYSGDKEISFPGGYETEGNIVIVQDQPLPLTVTALVAKLATYE